MGKPAALEIFEQIQEPKLNIDSEELGEKINVDEIEEAAKDASFALCKNLREVYFDEEFMAQNPRLKERLDVELESLRVLIKMRKSDEIAHDLCLKSIGSNANNASLYKALSQIQGSLLSIQRQMDETVKNINSMLKNIQLEINFEQNQQNNTTQEQQAQQEIKDPNTTRGSKKFIEQMRQELDNPNEENQEVPIDPNSLFEDTIDTDENENDED